VTSQIPLTLTIAGFDPSGEAGIIADVRTFVQFGCRAAAAMTSLTFQNAASVFGATHETAKSLRAQIVPIVAEQKLASVKIGMLPTAKLVAEVASLIHENWLPAPVLDPVLKSSSGYKLIEADAIPILLKELLPLARLVTPNIPEAEFLTGVQIANEDGMRHAAAKLRDLGARAVLIKGGHAEWRTGAASEESGKSKAVDLFDDEGEVSVLKGEWIDAPPVRGTGCMMSAAIAASLAHGADLVAAISAAKKYVAAEIQNSKFQIQDSKVQTQNSKLKTHN
jgi:hydroxymethylpyrimidine/phosphomethylpyrimidine kinase